MPTTREIATACGYSQATVSHALNGHPKIPVATQEYIRGVAEKMGWRPNAFVSAYMAHLKTNRAPAFQAVLAFLLANKQSGKISDQSVHTQRHFAGAQIRAKELGYELVPIWLNEPGVTARRLNQILHNRNVPGILIPGWKDRSEIYSGIEWSKFVAVTLSYALPTPNLNRVAIDSAHGFALMLKKAIELGYRRVAVMVSDEYDARVNHGVLMPAFYARERWAPKRSIQVCRFARSHQKEIPRIQTWLRRNRPDIVLAEEVVRQAIEGMRWRVPQDVAFISIDWAPEYPDFAGFNQHHELHGAVGIDMLVSQILHNQRGFPEIPRVVLVKGDWADGLSAPPKAEAARTERSAQLR